MERLHGQLVLVQRKMGEVGSDVTKVAEIESSRRLTREEARWASRLRLESTGLRHELRRIQSEFYRIKDEQTLRDS